ncbi:MAG TPA: cytochrome ubiquinol oxidase subunit I [Pseudonocardiaceae bacterium]|nr:cytochrome ubiquinol oxidase subunit I [Pseudonocardiaceae bacterium]
MTGTALGLARVEFGITASVHFLFAAVTLGLLPVVAVFQTRWVVTGRPVYQRLTRFWGNIYLINYAVGIVTGLVMEFQLGMNWSGLTGFAGNVFGAPLALETILAFFAESTFVGLWILGWGRLRPGLHLALIWLITATAYLSAFWVMIANGFLQDPVGYAIRGGSVVLTDWAAVLTNPGALYGLAHLVAGALTAGGFVVTGISAYHWARRTEEREFFGRSLFSGLAVAAGGSVATILLGIPQFGYLSSAQPTKSAVITGKDQALAVAQAAMRAAHGPGDYAPPSIIYPLTLVMMGLGLVLAAVSLTAFALRGRVIRWRPALWGLVGMIPLPFVALIAGWLVRELGRQPWVIYGVERTSAAGGSATVAEVLTSLVLFTAIYVTLAVVDYRLIARAARAGSGAALLGAEEPVPAPV